MRGRVFGAASSRKIWTLVKHKLPPPNCTNMEKKEGRGGERRGYEGNMWAGKGGQLLAR